MTPAQVAGALFQLASRLHFEARDLFLKGEYRHYRGTAASNSMTAYVPSVEELVFDALQESSIPSDEWDAILSELAACVERWNQNCRECGTPEQHI